MNYTPHKINPEHVIPEGQLEAATRSFVASYVAAGKLPGMDDSKIKLAGDLALAMCEANSPDRAYLAPFVKRLELHGATTFRAKAGLLLQSLAGSKPADSRRAWRGGRGIWANCP